MARKMSPLMELWFKPCLCACNCPKHNPPRPPEPKDSCGPPVYEPPMDWEKKCIYEKHPCGRNHGSDCDCCACLYCREGNNFQCHLDYFHEKSCNCTMCMEPHDYGCQCSLCRGSKKKGILKKLNCFHPEPKECKCNHCNEEEVKIDEKAELKKSIMHLGAKCYCLYNHPPDCECVDCKECRAEIKLDKFIAKQMLKRHKELFLFINKIQSGHREDCDCLKCKAVRLRVEITMCNEHLDTCRCANQKGKACRCTTCMECWRRKRNATMPMADDYW